MFREDLEQVRSTDERVGRRLRDIRSRQMDKKEIEELRQKVGCAALHQSGSAGQGRRPLRP
jgi:hypothetical protein